MHELIVHDLKGPLGAILGNMELLRDAPLAGDLAESVNDTVVAVGQLDSTVRNLLDEAGFPDSGLTAHQKETTRAARRLVETTGELVQLALSGNDMARCTVPDPCRTFDVAISKTNSGGEVVVLSTAGYGPFTVTKSVSIISPPAYHAAMAPTSGTAITVNAPGATVVLRNLYLNSLGADTGVSIRSATIVHIEGLVVNYFGLNAVEITGMISARR